ncbi:MAG: HU family DNA-binding protein [Rickettsiaceae bacterium]|nr:HU family DNA-binding protein [Rickettsiaceae bacterium]
MNKGEFVAYIADRNNCTKADATKIVDMFTEGITGAVGGGDDVLLVGFGSFYISNIKARDGRNPQTGATIKIPASRQPKFRAGQKLKDACN